MALKPEASIGTGLAVAGVVYAIHSNFTPTQADIQGLPSGNKDVDKSERQATWLSIGVVSGISLLAKDPTIFVIGAVATVGMAFFTRHAVWTDGPSSARTAMATGPAQDVTGANDLASGPQVTDTQAYSMYGHSDFVSS